MGTKIDANVSAVLERLDEKYERLVALELENARLRAENETLREALNEALQWTRSIVGMTRVGSETHRMLSKWRGALAGKSDAAAGRGSEVKR